MKIQIIALITIMLLGGLWHGAGWNFMLWGLLHGFALVFLLFLKKRNIHFPFIVSWLSTFCFLIITWIFFRAETFTSAMHVLQGFFDAKQITQFSNWKIFLDHSSEPFIILCALIIAIFGANSQQLATKFLLLNHKIKMLMAPILALLLFGFITLSASKNYQDFIYFQF